jgi:Tfp pilus assembly protein PilX
MLKISFLEKLNRQSGQALLIVVLVMVVALTVGLSIASKSITSFRNSTEQVNSQKALSAAEAGIEQASKSNTSIPITSISQDTKYSTDVTTVSGTTFLLNGSNPVLQGSGIDLWLTTYSSDSTQLYNTPYYPSSGSFTVYWGDSTGDNNNAALEVVVIAGTKASPVISRYAFDPWQIRRGNNHFAPPSGGQATVAGKKFYYQATIPVGNGGVAGGGGLIARVIPLYTDAIMGVNGTNNFPTQGSVITSVGLSGTTQRRVNVFQGYPELPAEYYLYNLFVP